MNVLKASALYKVFQFTLGTPKIHVIEQVAWLVVKS